MKKIIKQVASKQRITRTSTMIKPCPLNEICKTFTALSHQGCWASFNFVNDENFNGVVMIFFSFKITL